MVWYQVASQKVILGEAFNLKGYDLHSLWRSAPHEDAAQGLEFGLSLFDDDGREVADKIISMTTAERVLSGEIYPES